MSLPLELAVHIRKGARRPITVGESTEDLIYIKDYRTLEYYKRIDGRFVFARNLLPREVEDFYFNNGRSFKGCTIAEKMYYPKNTY